MENTKESLVSEEKAPRISQALFTGNAKVFRSIAILPSNVEAIEAAMLFSAGLENLVTLVGPSGWGKTHLLNAAVERMRTEYGLEGVAVHNAVDWLNSASRQPTFLPVVLDNVQACLAGNKSRQALRIALERRTRAFRPTLLSFTASCASRSIRSVLPQAREWSICTIKAPSVSGRKAIIQRMCESEGISVSNTLVNLAASKIQGNGRTYLGAVKRLKLQQSKWLTVQETLRACGILNPFLSDNSSWDLREHIHRIVLGRPQITGLIPQSPVAVSAYLMLREAWLCEAEVADYLKVEPKHVYGMAVATEKAIFENNETRIAMVRLMSDIVKALDEEP